jgi:hypothetical protein
LQWKTIGALKAHRKCSRRHFRLEVNGYKYRVFILIVFVPCGPVPISIQPFSYCDHRSRKLSGAYADRDAAHDPLAWNLADVSIRLLQIKDGSLLTLISFDMAQTSHVRKLLTVTLSTLTDVTPSHMGSHSTAVV